MKVGGISGSQRGQISVLEKSGKEVYLLDIELNYIVILVMNPDTPEIIERLAINKTGARIGRFTYRLEKSQPVTVAVDALAAPPLPNALLDDPIPATAIAEQASSRGATQAAQK